MNCKDFESMIHEIVSRRAADKTKQLEALEHAGRCLWCALRLDEETKLTESLQAFARTLDVQRAPARVEEALVQAFRERTLREGAPRFGLAGKRLWRRLSWGLVFAATVAAAWVVVLRTSLVHPRSSVPQPQVASNPPLASSEPSPAKQGQPSVPGQSERQVKAQSQGAQSQVATRRTAEPGPRSSTNRELQGSGLDHPQQRSAAQAVPHGRSERAALDESASEVTTDFIPLGTCDDSECMAEAMLVRVSLPAEALLAFGLPMDNDDATEEPVQADVALGSDGVPLAIRLVN
ncbi:MAG: hypothetical protein ABSC21_08425 [Terriglobia bacterium]